MPKRYQSPKVARLMKLRIRQHRTGAIRHTQKRIQQRYGINMSFEDHKKILKDLSDNHDKYVVGKRISKKAMVYKYPFRGKDVYFLYDKHFNCLRTAFPPEEFEERDRIIEERNQKRNKVLDKKHKEFDEKYLEYLKKHSNKSKRIE